MSASSKITSRYNHSGHTNTDVYIYVIVVGNIHSQIKLEFPLSSMNN